MILVPGGKKCYCGKQGCADAYCAASVLTDDTKETLEQFMKKVEEQDGQAVKVWKEYLNNLAILISNLRRDEETWRIVTDNDCTPFGRRDCRSSGVLYRFRAAEQPFSDSNKQSRDHRRISAGG